jgi:glycosyltransferase involved in cell wall biosynthesis
LERIGVLIVAFNAASTLSAVLDRLPESFRSRVAEILVCDDASEDATYQVGLEHRTRSRLSRCPD